MSISKPRRSSSGKTSAALPTTPTEARAGRVWRRRQRRDGVVEVVGHLVEVAVLDPAPSRRSSTSTTRQTPPFIVTASGWAPPMPPQPAGERSACRPASRRNASPRPRRSLVGALQDALGADVDPRAGGHLAVHGQAELLEPAELRPGGPVATRLELAISTRGAHSWVRRTPTGRPDWTSRVSSSASVGQRATMASKLRQSRAALPVPP